MRWRALRIDADGSAHLSRPGAEEEAYRYADKDGSRAVIMRDTGRELWPAVTRSADGGETAWAEGEFDRG